MDNLVKIEDISVQKLLINIDVEPFNQPDIKKKIISLLPTTIPEKISFHIRNSNYAVANGLRRIISGELKTKILTCDSSDIDTNENFILIDELIGRINGIRINQDIPIDSEFFINKINKSINQESMIVYSSDIQISKKLNLKRPLFAETYRLANLKPGNYLNINKIIIKEDYGYNNAFHCLTTQFEYFITDYIIVTFLNSMANFIDKRIHILELIQLFKKYKIKYDSNDIKNLFRKKILIIPNKSYQNKLNTTDKQHIQIYDYIIENSESVNVDSLDSDDNFLKSYQSSEIKAENFFLSFITNGNVEPKDLISRACDNIKERLLSIKYNINNNNSNKVMIIKDDIKTIIVIKNEDDTIGRLITLFAFELDSGISLINDQLEHPLNRTIILNIKHSDPIKLIIDAINLIIKNFEEIKKYFI